jgi:CheY-like chemotaxis protein
MGTILIIEDDEATAQLIANVLRSLGHELLIASNGKRGLALAEEHELILILLDMRLPGITGWELAPIFRNKLNMKNIPIIAVSVQVDMNDPQRAIQAGCDEYITKPFNINELRRCVEYYLS